MSPPTAFHRLPAPLEAAIQRLKLAARGAAERSVDALGISALSATNAAQRDQLLEAQFELNRRKAAFVLAFDEAYDSRVRRDLGPRGGESTSPGRWDDLSLVEDRELELQVAAERFGLEIGHVCEWELRELTGYISTLLGESAGGRPEDVERHPLRPEIVGHAMLRGIDAVVERAEVRKLLQVELTRALATVMSKTYGEILAGLRSAGVQSAGLNVRARVGDSSRPALGSDRGSLAREAQSAQGRGAAQFGRGGGGGGSGGGAGRGGGGGGGGTPMGAVDAQLMGLIRRLAHVDRGGWAGDAADDDAGGGGSGARLPPNLIHAHRDELRRAAGGALDHVVIDVVGSLFDAILSDPKVPPQMAQQIARLQLPVLRAALGDPSFFSSRRHPVRRFVNRIASLGAAFDDFGDADAQRFLALVRELVEDIVEGDFDHIEPYEHKLTLLEQFVAEQARREVMAHGDPAAMLGQKEDDLRLQRHYAQRLQRELAPLAAPDFVREFLADVWSRVLLKTAQQGGSQDQRLGRLRAAGRELFMSVQPKAAPAQRKAFVAQLPQLMRELGEGLDLIAWPESARKAFFGMLLPAHAEALKGHGLRTLEYNLLQRQVEAVLEQPLPTREELPLAEPAGTLAEEAAAEAAQATPAPTFTAEEAARIGLLDEAAVDWSGPVDIDLGAEPELQAADLRLPGLPSPPAAAPAGPAAARAADSAPEPTRGASLADHVQLGFAYQMHLEGEWQKVRLTHISPARSFFVFTRGQRHRQAISLTRRMLLKMCETSRLRAFEAAYLMERATARARRQLAGLAPSAPR